MSSYQRYTPQPTSPYAVGPKKKQNNTILYVVIGAAAVLIISVIIAMSSGPDNTPPPPAPVPTVNLPEKDKREMYKSLFALKGMLKSTGNPTRAYQVLADRYHVPLNTVYAVENEGQAASWPRE